MRRVHLFELEDLPWVPAAIRDGGTDLLDLFFGKLGFYRGVAPKLLELLDVTRATRVIDLCSGGGGGMLHMREAVRAAGNEVEVLLTDRHPNEAGIARVDALGDPRTSYRREPLDAMAGGGDLAGVRTMSGALHHFRPAQVQALLAGIVARGEPVAFFDVAASPAVRRLPMALAPFAMAVNMCALFVGSMLLVPLLRPFRWSRLLFTYVVPLIPALVAWDGTISALRAYTPEELLSLARSVEGGARYEWQSDVVGPALYLTGAPAPSGIG